MMAKILSIPIFLIASKYLSKNLFYCFIIIICLLRLFKNFFHVTPLLKKELKIDADWSTFFLLFLQLFTLQFLKSLCIHFSHLVFGYSFLYPFLFCSLCMLKPSLSIFNMIYYCYCHIDLDVTRAPKCPCALRPVYHFPVSLTLHTAIVWR